MRVGIVGGGLAGVTLGAALAQKGIAFELFERAHAFVPVGAGIALMPPALRVAERLGLQNALRARSCLLSTLRWFTARGRPLLEVPYADLWGGREVRSIHRHHLHQILLSLLPAASVHPGMDVTALSESQNEVELRTQTTVCRRYDLVVGADGVHSCIRQLIYHDTAPRFLGQNYWRATLRRDDVVESYELRIAPDRSLGMVPIGDGSTHFFAQQISDEPLTDALDGRLARLRQRFEGFDGVAGEALASLPSDADVHFGHGYEISRLGFQTAAARGGASRPGGLSGRVILIGDADHATSPNLGVGGAMAMEDGLVLAEELARAPVDAALAAFAVRRRPRLDWVEQRTRAWVDRARSAQRIADPISVYREDYAPLLADA